jgi:hypothetical protein
VQDDGQEPRSRCVAGERLDSHVAARLGCQTIIANINH